MRPQRRKFGFEPNARSNGAKPRKSAPGGDAYLERRGEERDRDDTNLLEAMRSSPGATIHDWATAIGKSRTSTIGGLKRLRNAGLASNEDGVWTVVEESAPAQVRSEIDRAL